MSSRTHLATTPQLPPDPAGSLTAADEYVAKTVRKILATAGPEGMTTAAAANPDCKAVYAACKSLRGTGVLVHVGPEPRGRCAPAPLRAGHLNNLHNGSHCKRIMDGRKFAARVCAWSRVHACGRGHWPYDAR